MITIPQFLDFATDTDNTEIVQGFLKLLELKSHGLFLHSQQVANYAAATAIKMGLPLSEVNGIKTAALLHDIGQLAIPNIIWPDIPISTSGNGLPTGATVRPGPAWWRTSLPFPRSGRSSSTTMKTGTAAGIPSG